MEHFNIYTLDYEKALKNNSILRYLLKIELLAANENVIGEITKDLTFDTQGQININYNQMVRRSCSLTVANVENKYIPSPDNPIWYNRKFKLWIGIMDNKGDIYWWSQGVYHTRSATANAHTVSIEAIDKGGALDGTLKTGLVDAQYIIEKETSISDAIKQTLSLDNGKNIKMNNSSSYAGLSLPIDPIQPLIDLRYNDQKLQTDVSIDTNSYIGQLITSIADSYGADVYYDTEGRLCFMGIADIFFVDGYRRMAHQWDFIDLSAGFSNPNYEYNFDGINAVTVYTNLSSDAQALANAQIEAKTGDIPQDESEKVQNIYYTAYNLNPHSPLRVGAVGLRQMANQEVEYFDTDQSDMETRCQQYAVFLLQKESLKGMNVSFTCPLVPHLDVNKTVGITDEYQNINAGTFVIQSITIPLGAGAMNVSATNINWLPVDSNIEGMGVR